jgi:hypothetical protein
MDEFEENASVPPMAAQFYFWTNPYRQGFARSQAAFIKTVGGDIRKDEIVFRNEELTAKRYNENVDALVAKTIVDPNFAIYWSLPYVSLNDGRLVYARLGEPAPDGTTLFRPERFRIKYVGSDGRTVYAMNDEQNIKTLKPASGILSDADFLWAIADGHFPGTFAHERLGFNRAHGSIGEPAFMHELGHLGGFIEVPEGMVLFRKLAKEACTAGRLSEKRDRRIFFANEMLLLMKPTARAELAKFLRGFGITEINEEKIIARLSELNDAQLMRFKKALTAWHVRERLPFGGSIRAATMMKPVGARLDKIIFDTLKTADWLFKKKRSFNESARSWIRDELAEYIVAAEALSETTIKGWFDLASQDVPLQPDNPYFRYLCNGDSPVEYAEYFCPQ